MNVGREATLADRAGDHEGDALEGALGDAGGRLRVNLPARSPAVAFDVSFGARALGDAGELPLLQPRQIALTYGGGRLLAPRPSLMTIACFARA